MLITSVQNVATSLGLGVWRDITVARDKNNNNLWQAANYYLGNSIR